MLTEGAGFTAPQHPTYETFYKAQGSVSPPTIGPGGRVHRAAGPKQTPFLPTAGAHPDGSANGSLGRGGKQVTLPGPAFKGLQKPPGLSRARLKHFNIFLKRLRSPLHHSSPSRHGAFSVVRDGTGEVQTRVRFKRGGSEKALNVLSRH